jgi:hypothetical protein
LNQHGRGTGLRGDFAMLLMAGSEFSLIMVQPVKLQTNNLTLTQYGWLQDR